MNTDEVEYKASVELILGLNKIDNQNPLKFNVIISIFVYCNHKNEG